MTKMRGIAHTALVSLLLAGCGTGNWDEEGSSSSTAGPLPTSSSAAAVVAPQQAALEEVMVTGSRIRGPGGRAPTYQAVPEFISAPAFSYPAGGEQYASLPDNAVRRVAEAPVSTFSIDVDTASYSNVRRMLNAGRLPPADAVRSEEFINYFSYDYAPATQPERPFSLYTEIAPSPWQPGKQLLHIGLKGYHPPAQEQPPANLVFLVDVSGSMQADNKLPLLKGALKLLSRQLDGADRISLVVYAGASGVVLEPMAGNERGRIEAALDSLQAGGGTNGGAGIQLAYSLAREAFIEGGLNRVILASDGDFNVGITDFAALLDLIREQREGGITLAVLGFGSGNLNDHLMEQLADRGNGNYAYIDTLNEARKVLVDELAATLQVIASDVKIQLEFNPAVVSEYRLVGYENRQLRREDFNNDQVDAGEVGAGHSVTALYELSLRGSGSDSIPALRYQPQPPSRETGPDTEELAYLKLRYKLPGEARSRLIEEPIVSNRSVASLAESSETFRFAAAVASLAQLLGDSLQGGEMGYDAVLSLAAGATGEDAFGYRAEFLNLVRSADLLDGGR